MRSGNAKQPKRPPLSLLAQPLLQRSVRATPFVDQLVGTTPINTSVFAGSLLTSLASASGLLQQFPQHATPVFMSGGIGFRLRQNLHISHIELDIQVIGSQGTVLLPGDFYNTVRTAVYRTGDTFVDPTLPYLTGILTTQITDVQHVYLDRVDVLMTQAFDSTDNNVPGVRHHSWNIPINKTLSFYSTNATGIGATWETREQDFLIEFISDSAVIPHPSVSYCARVWFEFTK